MADPWKRREVIGDAADAARIKWDCPHCHYENEDAIDGELGPFLTVTCSGCGLAFGQHEVSCA